MKKTAGKMLCLTPTPGKQGTHIDRWKYEMLRRAIRRAVPKNKTSVEFRKLAGLVRQQLAAEELQTIGSLPWHTTTVKLHLEVIGEIARVPGAQPQRLRRAN
ncbi:MAG: hypothetical protein ONB48_07530 [candidate division KSB1 bacterium]|nr:hypothetical protein [candidate division KSB1 bacterium]MDZ7274672.1 hypothetical protein [candidate division KSB1 bacterium]MDZ7285497.1 hypothetical protein [candidate division KSB1 bacterium]MDZ7298529.1 hypothetical protein [candidate division KSB1 bacterium]MDZ7306247.1 hypothetical protein [candidate division KSB1 bacterium]